MAAAALSSAGGEEPASLAPAVDMDCGNDGKFFFLFAVCDALVYWACVLEVDGAGSDDLGSSLSFLARTFGFAA